MDEKFLDDNAINTSFGGKSSMELEQSGQNICVAVKGVLSYIILLNTRKYTVYNTNT